MNAPQREARVQAWALRMLTLLGVRLELRGQPPVAGPVLLVANHISWLDILVMHAARHCRFVSKADVRHWPLIGTLADGAGTLYIERESRRDAHACSASHVRQPEARGDRGGLSRGHDKRWRGPAAVPRQPDPGRHLGRMRRCSRWR